MSRWSIIIGLMCLGVLNEGLSAVVWGALLCAAAVFLHRDRTGSLSEQFSLSAVMTGVVMFTIGFGNLDGLGIALAACFAAAVLYVPFDHATFRFMSVAFALMLFSMAVWEDFGKEVLHAMILLETIGAGLIFTRLPQSIFRPLGYALAAAMLTTILLLVPFRGEMSVWPAALVQVCAQLWLLNFAMSTGQKRVPFVFGFSAAAAGTTFGTGNSGGDRSHGSRPPRAGLHSENARSGFPAGLPRRVLLQPGYDAAGQVGDPDRQRSHPVGSPLVPARAGSSGVV